MTSRCLGARLQILRQEGLLAFTTGLGPTLWRNCVWNTIFYGTMEQLGGDGNGGLLQPLENPVLQTLRCEACASRHTRARLGPSPASHRG
jgi:hypothetical protein